MNISHEEFKKHLAKQEFGLDILKHDKVPEVKKVALEMLEKQNEKNDWSNWNKDKSDDFER